jgi:Peptidase U49
MTFRTITTDIHIHHEIAHVTLGHSAAHSVLSQDEEKAADKQATTWLLARAADAQQRRVRTLGTIIGILALDTFEAVLGDPSQSTHPRAYLRLADCLDCYDAPDDDEAFAFALCGMQFNLQQRGSAATLDGASFRSILDDHLVAMNRATAAR